MSDASELQVPAASLSAACKQSSHEKSGGLLPFRMIESTALCCDVALILIISVLTGIGYHFIFLDRVGPVETFLSIGAIVCVNFSAILAARGDYRPQNLTDFWRQVRETTSIWVFVFLLLSAVAFSFKIGDAYSRGANSDLFRGWRYRNHPRTLDYCPIYRARPGGGRFCRTESYSNRREGAAHREEQRRGTQALRLPAGTNLRVYVQIGFIFQHLVLAFELDARNRRCQSAGTNRVRVFTGALERPALN